MKAYIVVLLLLGSVFAAPNFENDPRLERGLSEQLEEALEKFRKIMREGDPDNNIPIMDPFDINAYSFNFSGKALSMDINAGDIVLSGLSDFIVHNIDFNMIRMLLTFDITMPMTVMHAKRYNFTGLVFNALPIYGDGVAHFEIGNFYFTGATKIAVGFNGVYLRDLKLELFVESLKSQTTGMLGGGDIDNVINAIMADMAPEFFNKNSEAISEMISGQVLTQVNTAINGTSLSDIIDMILG